MPAAQLVLVKPFPLVGGRLVLTEPAPLQYQSSDTRPPDQPSDCLPESEAACTGKGKLFLATAPFGLDLGWTEVTVSTGAGRGELKAEDVEAAADVELETAGEGLVLVAEVSLRPSCDQSGLGK